MSYSTKPLPFPRLSAATLLTGLCLTAGAAPAQADSIAYVKGGDVYLATGDGARSYRVTTTGGFTSVSQDDAGRMVAVHGNKIAHLARDGRVLADILTPVSNPSGTQTFQGPFDAQLSPNGAKVSYTYYWQYIGQDPYCNPSTNCYTKRLYQGTGYTDPDQVTEWDAPGYRRQTGWIHGSWIDDDTQLLSDPSMKPNEDLVLNSPALDKDAGFKRWAEHRQAEQMEDGEMTRDRTKMAYITGGANDHVWFYNVRTGFFPDYPSTCNTYELNKPTGGRFHDLSWSPDGGRLAYAEGDGVSTIAIPAFGAQAGDCGVPSEDSKLILPGASSPDWGPADVPAGAGAGGGAGGAASGGGPAGGGPAGGGAAGSRGTGATGAGGGAVTGGGAGPASAAGGGAAGATIGLAPTGGGLRAMLRSGIRVRITGAAPGRTGVTVKVGTATVAKGSVTVGRGGLGKGTLRINAAGRRRLAGRRTATLTLTTAAGATATVTVKR